MSNIFQGQSNFFHGRGGQNANFYRNPTCDHAAAQTVFIMELANLIYKVPLEPVGQIVENSHQAAHMLALIIGLLYQLPMFEL